MGPGSVSFILICNMKKILSFLFVLSINLASFAQDDVKTLHETAKTFMRSGDFDNAVIVLTRALQQDKKNLELQKDLVMSYYLKRDYTKALEGVKSLLDRDDADDRNVSRDAVGKFSRAEVCQFLLGIVQVHVERGGIAID